MDYRGKYFSVVGDSISTLYGFIPDGYALYYIPETMKLAGIESEKDTWWGQIISRLGGKLLKNNSWSGSTVSYHAEFTPGSFAYLDSRMSMLGDGDKKPDVIMIYMGVNDWASGTPIEATGDMEERESFAGSYRIMLDLIKKHYPDAEVWCIAPAISTLRGDPKFEFPYFLGGRHIREYADAIGKVAAEKGCIFVDANRNTKLIDALDGIHPDKNGMKTLADEILTLRDLRTVVKKSEMKKLIENSVEPKNMLRMFFKYDADYRYGYPYKTGERLFLVADEDDFLIDGFSVRRFRDLAKLGVKADKCVEINRETGILNGLNVPDIDIADWQSVFTSLQKLDKNIIVEHASEDDDEWDFWIGRIVKVLKNKLIFKHFTPDGKWEKEPYDIPYSQITNVTFDCRYVNVFSKYVK